MANIHFPYGGTESYASAFLAARESPMNRFAILLAALLCALAMSAAAEYPERPVKLVIGVPAGGASDAAARLVAQSLTRSLGQPVIVENRPGAGTAIAAQAVYGAAPDGYTLLWAMSSMTALPTLQKSIPFKSFSEFAPVSMTCRLPHALYVHTSVPASSVQQLVAYARANPGKLNYATGPLSEYMAAVHFMKATGTSMVRVPYKGGAPAMIDLVEGRVQVYFTPLAQGLPQAKAGKVKMLATMMPARSEQAPEVPTLSEAGVADIAVPNWNAVVAPPKTPQAIVERLAREIARALQDPAIRASLAANYLVAESSTPAELAAAIAQSQETWRRFIAEYDVPQE
jgi:tripartite-type tricarboxylate transporter receptor subunit TctC